MGVEKLFTNNYYTLTEILPIELLNSLDRRRLLGHVIGDAAQKLLGATGVNPVGLTITVTASSREGLGEIIEVYATAPQYDATLPE